MKYFLLYLLMLIGTGLISSCSIEKKLHKQREEAGINLPFVYFKNDSLRNASKQDVFYYDLKKKDSIKIGNYLYLHLFAGQTEVTNKQYNVFLNSLKADSLFELYEVCKPYAKGWYLEDTLNPFFDSLSLVYRSTENYLNCPVVNITPQAMKEYIKWLNRIEPSPNVFYKLPDIDDWMNSFNELGVLDSSYAWQTKSYKNQHDIPLGNFAHLDEEQVRYDQVTDKLSFYQSNIVGYEIFVYGPMNVYSYNPNSWGGYCFSGNVAEYIDIARNEYARDSIYFTKGGSWNSPPYYGRKHAWEHYVLPSPCVGFRVYKYEMYVKNH